MVVNSVSLLQIGYYLLLQSNQTVIHHLYTPPFESKLIFELSKKQNFIKISNKNVISALQKMLFLIQQVFVVVFIGCHVGNMCFTSVAHAQIVKTGIC